MSVSSPTLLKKARMASSSTLKLRLPRKRRLLSPLPALAVATAPVSVLAFLVVWDSPSSSALRFLLSAAGLASSLELSESLSLDSFFLAAFLGSSFLAAGFLGASSLELSSLLDSFFFAAFLGSSFFAGAAFFAGLASDDESSEEDSCFLAGFFSSFLGAGAALP